MTYLLLNLAFLAVAAAAAAIAALRLRRGTGIRPAAAAAGLTGAALCLLTAVFDNVMIAAGLFAYRDEHISGWTIGAAPIEDFCYVIAAALLLPALWTMLPRRTGRSGD